WLLDKRKPLADILRDQGHLSAERLQLLSALVAEHLKQHGSDPHRSLAALSGVEPVLRARLAALPDAGLHESLRQAGANLAPPAASQVLSASPSIVRYRVLRPHARGGLGDVFIAEDTELGRQVALKEIQLDHADPADSRQRFVREAEITGGLEHPGIVPVYGLGTYADGRPFYAMRFVRGDNLQQAIQQFHGDAGTPLAARQTTGERALAFRALLGGIVDVCQAVAYAHGRGVLHLVLKPACGLLCLF